MKGNNFNFNNHANQLNPNNDLYEGNDFDEDEEKRGYSKEELDNHANQLNPNNDTYWSSRGK